MFLCDGSELCLLSWCVVATAVTILGEAAAFSWRATGPHLGLKDVRSLVREWGGEGSLLPAFSHLCPPGLSLLLYFQYVLTMDYFY